MVVIISLYSALLKEAPTCCIWFYSNKNPGRDLGDFWQNIISVLQMKKHEVKEEASEMTGRT